MSRPIIEVSNLSKAYRLGEIGTSSFREEVADFWRRLRDRGTNGSKGDFWALHDVSFSVQPGEVVGIIGRNGAGKSTLLKILSRITEPTGGRAVLRGRVASLLEVGTGFHPDLTGRDNIYLNGAILGMTRAEIRKKFDEIVAFAEVEQFIDTPVKHYSSGMYVRLAFAVAAHLEPEILIVDEVLAVGDAAFQKKCLGKMQEVSSRHKRTVLFVSHNMPAMSRLATRCLVLEKGGVTLEGGTSDAVDLYMRTCVVGLVIGRDVSTVPRIPGGSEAATFLTLGLAAPAASFRIGERLAFQMSVRAHRAVCDLRFSITIFASDSTPVGTSCARTGCDLSEGEVRDLAFSLPAPRLAPGRYYCVAALGAGYCLQPRTDFDILPNVLQFEITPQHVESGAVQYWNDAWGRIALPDMEAIPCVPADHSMPIHSPLPR